MTTLWSWSSTADSGFTSTVGTAPSNETAGSYGQRWVWPSTTAQAYGYKSGFAAGDFGVRFIHQFSGLPSPAVSVCVLQGVSSAPANLFRVDITTSPFIRIRDGANTTLATGTVALSAGTEYRWEIYRSGTTLNVKVYNLAGTLIDSISATVVGTAVDKFIIGNNASITGSTFPPYTVDEIVIKDVGSEVGAVSGSVNASAGSDVTTATPLNTQTLDGSLSNGSSYSWSLVGYTGDDPGTVTIINPTTKTASYKIPATFGGTVLQFRITVNGTVTDDVYHTVPGHKHWLRDSGVWKPMGGDGAAVQGSSGAGSTPAAPAGWAGLLWADYFEGSSLDTAKWWARNGKSQSPNIQKAVYLASQVEVSGGMLHIKAAREDVVNSGTSYKWVSAGIQSDGLMVLPTTEEWLVECRYKINMVPGHSRGIWPAVWFRNAPSVGEIDGMEAWGTPANNSLGDHKAMTTFWQNTNGGPKLTSTRSETWDEWHVMKLHGDPTIGTYKLYIDDVLKVTRTVADASWLHGTEYSSPFYVRIENQIGKAGSYYGEADDSLVQTNGDYEFLVDYIRAYKRT